MFHASLEKLEPDRVTRYSITTNGVGLTFSGVLDLWQTSADFRLYFTELLAGSPFSAFRWETPALTKSTANQLFQFVLIYSPGFCTRKTDRKTYASYFITDDTDQGVVSFASLGGDAILVVPSPRTGIEAYGHLAAFVRHAPKPQLDAFWRVVGTFVKSRIGDKPLWVSTAGGGVAWLHVRLDSRPKYYSYSPYKTV